MVSYKDLGLVNTKKMFAKAIKGGYAIPAYNFNNMEQLQAIIQACVETNSPVILQVSSGARKYANQTLLRYMAQGAVAYAKELGCKKPQIALHLDHGDSFELCKSCIQMGFSSVMIDGSALPYEENVKLTKKVCDYAHKQKDYVTVEGELGVLAGVEDDVSAEESHYTKPEEVQDFVKRTGVDSLAISIGTSHGRQKFKPEQCTKNADGILIPPPLAFDVLSEIEKKLPGFPIVLHGSSSVPIEYVKQKIRRKIKRFRRHPRSAAAQSRKIGRVQNQHRLRRTPRNDRGYPQSFCRKSERIRPAQILGPRPRRTEKDVHSQKQRSTRFGRPFGIGSLSIPKNAIYKIAKRAVKSA